jgi:soluble lytic murein transglycosylase-like protein
MTAGSVASIARRATPQRSPFASRSTAAWFAFGLAQSVAVPALAQMPAEAGAARGGTSVDAVQALTEAERLIRMGEFFDQSEPPSQDLARARDLYCRAALLGHAAALRRLGWMYLHGRGVAVNEPTAGTLFRWAAALGDGPAAGLASAYPAAWDASPPCLAQQGVASLETLRERARSAATARDAAPPATDRPATPRVAPGPASADQRRVVQLVTQEARSFLLDPRLVLAVIRAESGFDPLARSAKNAMGLMQLIPETAHRFNVADPLDPLQNVRGGMSYLRWLLAYYRGDVVLVLAAYNAGEGAVDRHRGVPPFAETIGYVQRIRALYPFDRHPFDRKALASGERTWLDRGMANTQR